MLCVNCRCSLADANPWLVAATCLALASEVEEQPLHRSQLVQAMQKAIGSELPQDREKDSSKEQEGPRTTPPGAQHSSCFPDAWSCLAPTAERHNETIGKASSGSAAVTAAPAAEGVARAVSAAEAITLCQSAVLFALGFDLHIHHPYRELQLYVL